MSVTYGAATTLAGLPVHSWTIDNIDNRFTACGYYNAADMEVLEPAKIEADPQLATTVTTGGFGFVTYHNATTASLPTAVGMRNRIIFIHEDDCPTYANHGEKCTCGASDKNVGAKAAYASVADQLMSPRGKVYMKLSEIVAWTLAGGDLKSPDHAVAKRLAEDAMRIVMPPMSDKEQDR